MYIQGQRLSTSAFSSRIVRLEIKFWNRWSDPRTSPTTRQIAPKSSQNSRRPLWKKHPRILSFAKDTIFSSTSKNDPDPLPRAARPLNSNSSDNFCHYSHQLYSRIWYYNDLLSSTIAWGLELQHSFIPELDVNPIDTERIYIQSIHSTHLTLLLPVKFSLLLWTTIWYSDSPNFNCQISCWRTRTSFPSFNSK